MPPSPPFMRHCMAVLGALAIVFVTAHPPRLLTPAWAASAATPDATIRSIYKPYETGGNPDIPESVYSPRLRGLLEKDRKETPKDEVGRLDFDPFINGQDWQIKALTITTISLKANQATVRASFKNFDTAEELVYSLVRSGDRWLIDEITSTTKPQWTLSKILTAPLDGEH